MVDFETDFYCKLSRYRNRGVACGTVPCKTMGAEQTGVRTISGGLRRLMKLVWAAGRVPTILLNLYHLLAKCIMSRYYQQNYRSASYPVWQAGLERALPV